MNTDKVLGGGLVALGVAACAMALQINARTFNDDPGPQLFPLLACAILVICGIGLLFARDRPQNEEPAPGSLGRGAIMAGLMVLYAVGLWLVGFYVATVVMVYAFYHVIAGPEKRRPWVGAAYAACVTGGVHLLFAVFLKTFLPQGILI